MFDEEFLKALFGGIENAPDIVAKIMAQHDADTNGLKRKVKELLEEQKKFSDKHEALKTEKQTLEESVKELDGKLKDALPEQQKKHFETEIQKREKLLVDFAAERDRTYTEKDAKITALEKEHHDYMCKSEFNSLLNADSSINPVLREHLEKIFFNDNSYQCDEMNGAKKLLNTITVKTMKDDLTAFLNTPAGQYYRVNQSTGGGAAGSSGIKPGQNQITREQLDAMPAAQRQEFFAKGGKLTT